MPNRQSAVRERFQVKFREPAKYIVYIHNDDITTMDFVVFILVNIFHKSEEDANALMLKVHNGDKAQVGIYPYDIAKSKADKATKLARENGYPLRLSVVSELDITALPF